MRVTEVGKLLITGQTSFSEGAVFEYTASGPILIIALPNPTPKEIGGAKTGSVELALYESPTVIFVLHKIAGLETWSDSPFSIRLYKNLEMDWSQDIKEGQGLWLEIVLVDASTGIVKSLRMVGTSTQFARGLRSAILQQLERPFSKEQYDAEIAEVYGRYSSEALLARAAARHTIRRQEI